MPMKNLTVPAAIGAAIAVLWMRYGDWGGLVPPGLTEPQEIALTGAVGVLATAAVNLVMRLIPEPRAVPTSPEPQEPRDA